MSLAILPAGTANLLATNLGLPEDLEACVRIGLDGTRRGLDVGKVNGEHFGVMAGAGLDAMMIRATDAGLKDRVGRIAYVWTGAKSVQLDPVEMAIDVDGGRWFEGEASCVLVGNVGDVFGGLSVFRDAVPDDGFLDLQFADPHPAAENFFGAAWSGCPASPPLQILYRKIARTTRPRSGATSMFPSGTVAVPDTRGAA